MKPSRPPVALTTLIVVLLTGLWGYLRLILFNETVLPLTFVLPLLVCIWTGRRWQLWSMAVIFAAMVLVKVLWILPTHRTFSGNDWTYLFSTLVNIFVGALVVQAILLMKENLETRNATISAQNAELEAQTEELSQQNEEIEAQSEEVTRQNEDLTDLNARLTDREAILEGVLRSTRGKHSVQDALDALCKRTLSILGSPATEVAIFECENGELTLRSRSAFVRESAIPEHWPLDGSLAGVVLREKRTAYISELSQRADLAKPFDADSRIQSVLATPMLLADEHAGLLVACSAQPAHWTDDQFKIIEWIAAQCGLMIDVLRNQKALAEHAEALETANQSKDRFLAMLSHELRTPLTPVLAVAGTFEDDQRVPEDIREDLRMVRRNVAIQSRLIDDLLDLTRISRGKMELDRHLLPAAALLRDTVAIVGIDFDAKSQTLELNLDGVGEWMLDGDGPRLQQVFWNLLKNANKFSPHHATIALHATVEVGFLKVEIRDPGVGVEPQDVQIIFLPFEQRLNGPRRASDGGLGLGLAIAKAVVEMHGGQISLRSDGAGKGSTFVVMLPVAEAGRAAEVQPHYSSFGNDGRSDRKTKLLLVEDHGDTGTTLARLLRSAGYEVEHAETAAEGLDLFEKSHFDLVLSDLGLPDESGLDLMRKLRARSPDIRGICMSGYGMDEDIAASRAAGFVEHLVKPIELNRLKSVIAQVASGGLTRTV